MSKFIISESEKQRILEMHQNATSRQYLSEQAIYNWEGGGRKIKYKVQGNKYYTSRDEGKTYTELTKQEDAPKYEKIMAKPVAKVDETLDNSDASRQLFADGMVEYTTHCTTVAGLNSYWKSNQLQLDSLKVTHPDLYQQVLSKFQELKKQFSEGETK